MNEEQLKELSELQIAYNNFTKLLNNFNENNKKYIVGHLNYDEGLYEVYCSSLYITEKIDGTYHYDDCDIVKNVLEQKGIKL